MHQHTCRQFIGQMKNSVDTVYFGVPRRCLTNGTAMRPLQLLENLRENEKEMYCQASLADIRMALSTLDA